MAFKARLNFSGKEYQVLQYANVFNLNIDLFGSSYSINHGANIISDQAKTWINYPNAHLRCWNK